MGRFWDTVYSSEIYDIWRAVKFRSINNMRLPEWLIYQVVENVKTIYTWEQWTITHLGTN